MKCESHNSFIFIDLMLIWRDFGNIGSKRANHIHNISSVKFLKIR